MQICLYVVAQTVIPLMMCIGIIIDSPAISAIYPQIAVLIAVSLKVRTQSILRLQNDYIFDFLPALRIGNSYI